MPVNNIEAAKEYARRARKGLPEDRWANGTDGAKAVARGVDELVWAVGYLIDKLEGERTLRGVDAMTPHKDPMR